MQRFVASHAPEVSQFDVAHSNLTTTRLPPLVIGLNGLLALFCLPPLCILLRHCQRLLVGHIHRASHPHTPELTPTRRASVSGGDSEAEADVGLSFDLSQLNHFI